MFQWLFGKSKRPSAEAEARRMAGCREVVLQYAEVLASSRGSQLAGMNLRS